MNARKNIILNTWGVLIYFFAQWLLTMLVTRISGYEAAGQFSLAVSFTNVFSFIGMFGVRSLQVSDVSYKYTDGQYFALRCVTCFLSIILFAATLPLFGYTEVIVKCCIAMMVYKTAEAVLDVTIGSMQRSEQFRPIAVSYTMKAILTVAAFSTMLLLKDPVYAAVTAMVVVFIASFLLYDVIVICRNSREKVRFTLKGTSQILRESFPLMLTALIDSILIYLPRDAVERTLGSEALGYYSTVSIVVVVLSTLGSGVWGSIMPRISSLIHEKNFPEVRKTIRFVMFAMIVMAVFVLLLGSWLGPFFFGIIFGTEILDYMFLLVPVLINALLLLFNSFFQCVFIPINNRKILLYTNGLAVMVCMLLSNALVTSHSLIGACLGLTGGLALRGILLSVALLVCLRKFEKRG